MLFTRFITYAMRRYGASMRCLSIFIFSFILASHSTNSKLFFPPVKTNWFSSLNQRLYPAMILPFVPAFEQNFLIQCFGSMLIDE